MSLRPPQTTARPASYLCHGHVINDEYAWLRADNWQEIIREPDKLDHDIRAYLESENEYANRLMADTEDLRETLFTEMKGRIKEDDNSVPVDDGPWAYFIRYREGEQYPLFCRQPRGRTEPETILLDGNALAKDKVYFRLGSVSQSPDHNWLAYTVDDNGSEFYTLHVRDLINDMDLPDVIHDTSGAVTWSMDNQYLFYVRSDDHHRPRWVCRHKIGSPVHEDTLIHDETDPAFFISIGRTQDNRYIKITVHGHEITENYLLDATDHNAKPHLITPRRNGHQYRLEHNGDTLYILNNEQAEDFRISTAPSKDPRPENWRDIVAHQPGRLILHVHMLSNHLIWMERRDGLPHIVIRRLRDGTEHVISFAEDAYALELMPGREFDTTRIRFSYSSMTTPSEIFDYDVETREKIKRKTQDIPSGHDASLYVTKRLHAISHDGASVPISILHRRDLPLDGSAPLHLYGYGAYGTSMETGFSTNRLSLVDRGFICAIAHVRGGKEKGYRWYTEGKKENKKNSFLDFIAVGKHLVSEGYTSFGRIIAEGRSAGGLLVGAVANMEPELFLAIIAGVPFVDTLNTMLDESLPLTPPEWNEWGNPIIDKDAFDYIRSYSPYDNITRQDYPHILASGGLTDPRVTYWEPAKWVARLRDRRRNNHMLMLKTQMDAGHGGKSGRFDLLKELAFDYAFAIKATKHGDAEYGDAEYRNAENRNAGLKD